MMFSALYRFSLFTSSADGKGSVKTYPLMTFNFTCDNLESAQRKAWDFANESAHKEIANRRKESKIKARLASIKIVKVAPSVGN